MWSDRSKHRVVCAGHVKHYVASCSTRYLVWKLPKKWPHCYAIADFFSSIFFLPEFFQTTFAMGRPRVRVGAYLILYVHLHASHRPSKTAMKTNIMQPFHTSDGQIIDCHYSTTALQRYSSWPTSVRLGRYIPDLFFYDLQVMLPGGRRIICIFSMRTCC